MRHLALQKVPTASHTPVGSHQPCINLFKHARASESDYHTMHNVASFTTTLNSDRSTAH